MDEFNLKNLGERTLRKIEKRLFERYNLTLDQCLYEFEKLDIVLREFFGERAAEELEEKIFKSLHLLSE